MALENCAKFLECVFGRSTGGIPQCPCKPAHRLMISFKPVDHAAALARDGGRLGEKYLFLVTKMFFEVSCEKVQNILRLPLHIMRPKPLQRPRALLEPHRKEEAVVMLAG